MKDIIALYFRMGMQQSEIVGLLAEKHNVIIGLRHFRRILKTLKLARHKNYTDIFYVAEFISDQLQKSGLLVGYH